MTAAAGAVLGMETHLVLSGGRPDSPTGNQLLATLFGAQMHFTGADETHWGELEIAREQLTERLRGDGLVPSSIGIGGSTPVGAAGYALGYLELVQQCDQLGCRPSAIVFASSSGGTHAGLLAGRALRTVGDTPAPEVVAIGVAKGVNVGLPDVADLADRLLERMGVKVRVDPADVHVDTRWIGEDYAIPSDPGDAAIRWAARTGGWVLDRTYTGKGLAGLLGRAAEGRYGPGDDVVFIHTGGWPALFAPGGAPPLR
jgi:1-aminocyclopropane-1-carboxylate deaminase/D-cysteine desulfhydrase-like pyridoxal-dependent ACC family enzyme